MNQLLEKLIQATDHLPPPQLQHYVERWLAELADDQQWDASFEKSQDLLSKLADEALAEHRAGKTKPLFADDDA